MCCGTRWSRHKFSIRSVHIITSCVRHQHHKWVFRNIKPTGFARNKKDERVWTLMRRKLILQVCFLFTDFLHTVYRPLSQWPNRVQILMSMVFTEAHVKQSTVSCPGFISIRVLSESTSPHNPSAQPKFFHRFTYHLVTDEFTHSVRVKMERPHDAFPNTTHIVNTS